jgi:predicted nuclease of predicted toxin-antitoxin system
MKLTDFAILADENINPILVNTVRDKGFDVAHVNDVGLGNTPDHVILSYAYEQYRIVLTLDDDFGTLIFKNKQPFIGIVRLHPGHLVGDIHIPTLQAILTINIDYQLPFLLVAEKRTDRIHIRYRTYAD